MIARIPMIPLLGVLFVIVVSQAQPPDAKSVRKAINHSCAATEGSRDMVGKVEDLAVPAEGRCIPVRQGSHSDANRNDRLV